jgi:outer membrane receptor protein involved in Fe transport
MTRTFIDDIAATDLNEVLAFSANIQDIQDSSGGGNGDSQQFRLRGLLSKEERRRDGFLTLGRQDTYNLERVELLRGPQALLYGQGVTSGALNAVTKRADARRNFGEFRFQTDTNGTLRTTVDFNAGVHDKLGVRVNGLIGNQQFWQDNLHTRTKAGTVDLVYKLTPKLRTRASFDYLATKSVLRPGGSSVDFTLVDDSSTDPRNGRKLGELLTNGDTAGIIIAGGPLTWENYSSVLGANSADQRREHNLVLAVEAEPIRHLSLRIAFNQAKSFDFKYINNNVRDLLAPTDSRAINHQYSTRLDPSRNYNEWDVQALQAAVVYQLEFRHILTSQFVLGAESRKKNQTFLAQSLYLVGSDGIILAGSQDGGRRRVPITTVPVQASFPGMANYGDTRWAFRTFPNIRHENQDALYANWLGTWFKGRLETMAGGRLDQVLLRNVLEDRTTDTLYDTDETTGLIGGVFNVTEAFGVYANYGKSFTGASTLRRDPDNNFLPPSSGVGREIGLKLDLLDRRISGSIAYYVNRSKSENVDIGVPNRNVIDPAGINGRNGDVFVPAKLRTSGYEASLSMRPTKGWRVQLSAGTTDGEFESSIVRPIFYNDQFNTIPLADGTTAVAQRLANGSLTALLVPSVRNNAASPLVPLTLDMLKGPAGVATYGATINPVSGLITNAAGLRLTTAGVGTGATGLPISQHQLGFVAPNNGQYLLLDAGDRTTGYAERSVNLNTNYRFATGVAKGFSVGGTYQYRSKIRQGYATINGVRQLYFRPDTQAVGLRFGYQRKFQRVEWSSQINITNILDKQTTSTALDVNGAAAQVLRPDVPRTAVWTNTFSF